MKTTLEIPDPLFRQAKAAAAARDQTLEQLVNGALRDTRRMAGVLPRKALGMATLAKLELQRQVRSEGGPSEREPKFVRSLHGIGGMVVSHGAAERAIHRGYSLALVNRQALSSATSPLWPLYRS